MKKLNYSHEFILLLIAIIPFIFVIYIWRQLPNNIPIHFDVNGEIDGWGAKENIFILPAVNIGIYLFWALINYVVRVKGSNDTAIKIVSLVRFVIIILTTIVLSIILKGILKQENIFGTDHVPRILFSLILLSFAIAGRSMPDIKPNISVGIRTKWTLGNEVVWTRTHYVWGNIIFYAGLPCLFISLFLPTLAALFLSLAFILITLSLSCIYSYWLFKKLGKDKM